MNPKKTGQSMQFANRLGVVGVLCVESCKGGAPSNIGYIEAQESCAFEVQHKVVDWETNRMKTMLENGMLVLLPYSDVSGFSMNVSIESGCWNASLCIQYTYYVWELFGFEMWGPQGMSCSMCFFSGMRSTFPRPLFRIATGK